MRNSKTVLCAALALMGSLAAGATGADDFDARRYLQCRSGEIQLQYTKAVESCKLKVESGDGKDLRPSLWETPNLMVQKFPAFAFTATMKAREGKWIGATVGIYAVSSQSCRDRGWIDVDWFRVAEPGSRLCR